MSENMVTVLVLFGPPLDEAAFQTYLDDTHRPLLRRLPNVEQVTVHQVAGAATGQTPYRVVVELRFPSEKAMQDSLNSDEGQAMARDFQAFASGGATVLLCQSATD